MRILLDLVLPGVNGLTVCRDLDILIIAEDGETKAERDAVADLGIHFILWFLVFTTGVRGRCRTDCV